jgi:hypothetical protein
MQAAPLSNRPANENVRGVYLALNITDSEVVNELAQRDEGADRDAFAKQALRIGVLALRQASGALDAQTIQREGDRMLASVREALSAHTTQTASGLARLLGGYLDPASGSLPQRLESLTKRDGEIESLLAKHLDGERSTVAQTLARQVGEQSAIFKLLSPTQAGGLAMTLSAAIDDALRVQREEVLRQFSLDRPDSALSRLVGDIASANGKLRGELAGDIVAVANALSLDNEQGPLSRFVVRVEKARRRDRRREKAQRTAGALGRRVHRTREARARRLRGDPSGRRAAHDSARSESARRRAARSRGRQGAHRSDALLPLARGEAVTGCDSEL